MIRYTPQNQLTIEGFETPFDHKLRKTNRWVILASVIPWDDLAQEYAKTLNPNAGRLGVDIRTVLGAMIIKYKEKLSDRATVAAIEENIYMQYFCGYASFSNEAPFEASLFVDLRKRLGHEVFQKLNNHVIMAYEKIANIKKPVSKKTSEDKESNEAQMSKESTNESPSKTEQKLESKDEAVPKKGKLKLDATVADQYIKYPTDVNLLNESREQTERIIDELYKQLKWTKKPRTYRRVARKSYLNFIKKKKKSPKFIRKQLRSQLQYVNRNIKTINRMLDQYEDIKWPLARTEQRIFWVIQLIYDQQKLMYDTHTNRCDHRVVNIYQPYVRPIVRGKDKSKVEFGAKLSVSEFDGMAGVDFIHWEATHEAGDLPEQVEAYRDLHGYYPEVVIVDGLYLNRANRKWLKQRGIRSNGQPLGRPPKVEKTAYQKRKDRAEHASRNHIEGKFGQAKNGYNLNKIRAKLQSTSESWICAIFFVMNLTRLVKIHMDQSKKLKNTLSAIINQVSCNKYVNIPMYKNNNWYYCTMNLTSVDPKIL